MDNDNVDVEGNGEGCNFHMLGDVMYLWFYVAFASTRDGAKRWSRWIFRCGDGDGEILCSEMAICSFRR